MIIDIEHGFAHYSAEELIDYSNSRLLYAGSYCLSDLVDKIASYPSVEMLNTHEEEKAEAYQEGRESGFTEGRGSAISEAISLIEGMR